MTTLDPQMQIDKYDFRVDNLDLSRLVGFRLKLFSQQFPGREIRARIVAAAGRSLTAESGPDHRTLDNLVNQQTVVLQFPYQRQEISIRARLRRSDGGRCFFDLEDTATPLFQRRFHRVDMRAKVTLAPFPAGGVLSRKLGKLRWMETDSVNFSAGGVLINVSAPLDPAARLIVSVDQEQFDFPKLILVKVRHSYMADDIHCRAGVEFVTRELSQRIFSPFQMKELPSALFSYSSSRREQLNRAVRDWDLTINRSTDTGASNEN
jgi:hypothetical protein